MNVFRVKSQSLTLRRDTGDPSRENGIRWVRGTFAHRLLPIASALLSWALRSGGCSVLGL